MNFFAISGLLNGLAATSLAWLVYSRSPQNPRHWTYGLLGLSIAIWSFGYFAWQTADTASMALLFCRLLMCGAIFIPLTYLHHVLILTDRLTQHRILLKSNYLIGCLFLVVNGTPYFIPEVQPNSFFPFWPQPGPLFHIFLIWWGGVALIPHYLLVHAYRSEKDAVHKRQYLYLLIASGIAFTGGATNFPLWYGIEILPYGTICFAFYVSMIAYTLLRYDLMDFSAFVEKGLNYLTVLFLISQPAYPVLLLAQKSFFGVINYRFSMVQLFVHLLAVAGAYQMKIGIRGNITRLSFGGQPYGVETLSRFSTNMAESRDLQALGREIVQTLSQGIQARIAILYLLDQGKNSYSPVIINGLASDASALPAFSVTDGLPRYLAIVQSKVIYEELKKAYPDELKQTVISDLERLGVDLCLPFICKGRLLGFCALGPIRGGVHSLAEDVGLVTALVQEAAMALENALLREEIKQSQALVYHMDRLRSLETMAGGLAEELRNPLTSIKAFVQLAQLRRNDEEFLSRFRSVISEDVLRIEQLTKEIREYALPHEAERNKENMNEILTSCIAFITLHPQYYSLKFDKSLDSDLPEVSVDRQQIKQVFFNIFLHILKSLGREERILSVKSQTIKSSTGDHWIQIELSGTCLDIQGNASQGPGLVELQDDNSEAEERGLDIAGKIIEEHHGHLRKVNHSLSSRPAFSVTLPVSVSKEESHLPIQYGYPSVSEGLKERSIDLRLPNGSLPE